MSEKTVPPGRTGKNLWSKKLLLFSAVGLLAFSFRAQIVELYGRTFLAVAGTVIPKDVAAMAQESVASSLMEQGKYPEAAEFYEKAGVGNDPAKVITLADCYNRAKNYDRAISLLEPLTKRSDKTAVTAAQALSHVYARKGDLTATEKYCRLVGGGSDHAAASNLHSLACGMFNCGEYEAVRPMYRRAIELEQQQPSPNNETIAKDLLNLAGCDLKTEKYDSAVQGYEATDKFAREKLGEKHWIVSTARMFKTVAQSAKNSK